MADLSVQAPAPQKPKSLFPYMYDARSDEEKAKPPKKESGFKYIPPQASVGALEYTMEVGGKKVDIPIGYGKIEEGLELKYGDDKLKLVHGVKWGSPLKKEFNPKGDTVVTYHEAEVSYDHTFANVLSLGAVVEDRQKFSGDNWIMPMASVGVPYTNTQLRAGPLWHLHNDSDKPLQKGMRFSWQVVQPLTGVRGDTVSATLIFINEGEVQGPGNRWMNNVFALKFTRN